MKRRQHGRDQRSRNAQLALGSEGQLNVLLGDDVPLRQDVAQPLAGAGLVVHGLAELLMRNELLLNQDLAETGLRLLLLEGFHDIAFQKLRTIQVDHRDCCLRWPPFGARANAYN